MVARGICQIKKMTQVPRPAADIYTMSPITNSYPASGLPSAQDSGRAALATSSNQLNQDAAQIANPDNQSLTDPFLNSTQSLLLTQAGADVIRTSNEMIGTLLNVFA